MSDIKYDIKSVKILLNMKDEIIARQSAEIVAKDELIRELVEAVEEILNLSNPCCNRCEGGGRLWADGRCHGQVDVLFRKEQEGKNGLLSYLRSE